MLRSELKRKIAVKVCINNKLKTTVVCLECEGFRKQSFHLSEEEKRIQAKNFPVIIILYQATLF